MVKWLYAKNGETRGPFSIEIVEGLIRNRTIGRQTMLTQEGSENWQPLHEIENLKKLWDTYGPDKYRALATRWPRLFARVFDVWWERLVVGIPISFVALTLFPEIRYWLHSPFLDVMIAASILPVVMVFDAVLFGLFGNTPGKMLLGLRVVNPDETELSFLQYVWRNLRMLFSGYGMGIPIVIFFTMLRQASRVGNGKPASYDQSAAYQVRSTGRSRVRMTVFVLLFSSLSVLGVIGGIRQHEDFKRRHQKTPAMGESWTWENPITNLSTQVEGAWGRPEVHKLDSGGPFYLFVERNKKASVTLGLGSSADLTMRGYMEGYLGSAKGKVKFEDKGRLYEYRGCPAWENSGRMNTKPQLKFKIRVIQVGDIFWRIVCVQGMPYDYSTTLSKHLEDGLLNTIVPPNKKPVGASTTSTNDQPKTVGKK